MSNDERPLDEILANTAWMRRLALRLVTDAAERDELVQEAWLRALTARAAVGERSRPWLSGVMRNLARMELPRRRGGGGAKRRRARRSAGRRRREERADAASRSSAAGRRRS